MKNNKNGGFVTTMILIVAGLIFIKYYFNIDPLTFFKSSQFNDVLNALKSFFITLYNWIDGVVKYILNNKK